MAVIVNIRTKKQICGLGDLVGARDSNGATLHSGDEVYLELKNGKAVGFFPVIVENSVPKLYGSRYVLGKASNIKMGSILTLSRSYSELKEGDLVYKNLQVKLQ